MLFRPLYQFPARVQRWYRHVLWRCNVAQRAVYLTFDDGPIPEMTPKILAILREKQVKATFFCVGDNARKYPELLRMILADVLKAPMLSRRYMLRPSVWIIKTSAEQSNPEPKSAEPYTSGGRIMTVCVICVPSFRTVG